MVSDQEIARDIVVAMIGNKPGSSVWSDPPNEFIDWVVKAYKQVLEAVRTDVPEIDI